MGGRVSSRGRHASAAPSTVDESKLDSSSPDKVKVVVLGEAAVGKTTLFRRWVGTPLEADYVPSTTALGRAIAELRRTKHLLSLFAWGSSSCACLQSADPFILESTTQVSRLCAPRDLGGSLLSCGSRQQE
ncbi:hypothetical protein DVH05_001678 [Phytophthora capsici]|nr:hypothetical protein DVH05_001678 [Phytophthora capsici]